MKSKAVDALRASRAAASQSKRQDVQEALAAAVDDGVSITLSGIADRAEVSRQFIYDHTDLDDAIKAAARAPRVKPERPPSSDDREQGAKADRGTLAAKIERQRTTVAELRDQLDKLEKQRRRWLGSQLEQQALVSPDEHAELRLVCDRLMDEKANLIRTVDEVRRINSILESDLAASREAHATDLAQRNSDTGGTVTPIVARKPSGP